MKMIKPSFEIFDIPDPLDHDAVLMHLEKIGRTCYKSEDQITPDSCIKFIQNIRDRKHWAMLEHYIFTVRVPEWIYNQLNDKSYLVTEDPNIILKSGFIHSTYWEDAPHTKYRYLVSFSVTALNYLIACPECCNKPWKAISHLFQFMKNEYPELMLEPRPDIEREVDKGIQFITRDEMIALPRWIRKVHDFMTVKFTVDRGVTHEIVRHRPASYAQESTRYCNYSQGKFGKEITVIIPSFFDTGMGEHSNSLVFDSWKHSCEVAEREYFELLKFGATPQQARSVLPNSLKADIIMTATLHEYGHFFNMRCDTPAHPQMKEIACPLLRKANVSKYYLNMFDKNMHMANNDKE